MRKILKEFAEEKDPEDNPDPLAEEMNPAGPVPVSANPTRPETEQLAELQEVERRFQTVFEAAPIGIAIANPAGYFVEVNDAFIDMLGYSRQEIYTITFVDLTHPDDRAETQRLSQAVRDGKINFYRTEKRYLKKNGAAVWAVVRATAIRDDDGAIKNWLGLMVDITEHKKAKEALAESEKKYRMLFESSAEGILVARIKDQQFKYANRAICEMLGYGPEELTRMGVHDILRKKICHTYWKNSGPWQREKEGWRKIFPAFARTGQKYLSRSIPRKWKSTAPNATSVYFRIFLKG